MWETIRSGNVGRSIVVNRKKNGEVYYVDESISAIRDAEGNITNFVSNGRDYTERLRLEAQLLQSQKMDAVGRLAGGIAHDFNNLLTIITSYSELALDSVIPESSAHGRIQEILSAARRAADLTRQLLAFSRKQPQALRVAELNPVVTGIIKTLRRLIGEDIELVFAAGEELGRIRLDPVQIEQILMNLAANSRDAMPQGGRCTIETSNVQLDEEYADRKRAVIPPGRYAVLSMTDTGSGIPADHLSHVFEPFYTTKPSGKGTGLGLATVYGIVKQNHGFVWVYSEPGMGTSIKIYLPCVQDQPVAVESPDKFAGPAQRGTETVLLVEDEEALRRATVEFLRLRGYTVLEARDGVDALSVSKNHGATIHLTVTDVVMPHMSGGELAREMETLRPQTRMLFVSGYAGQTVLDHKVVDVENNFLQKPFTLKQLASKVRTVLDHNRHPVPHGRRNDCASVRRYGTIRVSLPAFRRKRSPRQVTVWPPRLTTQTAAAIKSRSGISHAYLENLMVPQNAAAHKQGNRETKKQRDRQRNPGPERCSTRGQSEQRPHDPKRKNQTHVPSRTRVPDSTRPAQLMREEFPQAIRREKGLNHNIRQFHGQPQAGDALSQFVVVGEIVDE